MIHRTLPIWQTLSWQEELKSLVTTSEELFSILQLPAEYLDKAKAAEKLFPLRVPRSFIAKMAMGDVDDPLLKQVLPIAAETETVEGYSADPVGEFNTTGIPGLVHKYQSRVLLILSSGCAINCRYCFRRHFPYGENNPNRQGWEQAFEYVQSHPEINEVILSGGDPLVASDTYLAWMTEQIAEIKHISRMRIHTRLPIVIPHRVTSQLIDSITHPNLKTLMVLHSNHGNEIDDDLKQACDALKAAGITLLNQAVLLKGVNDTLEDQVDLAEALFNSGILPYYLHTLDKVDGAAHFDLPEKDAKRLHIALQAKLPGYLVPKLAREIESLPNKTLL